MCIRDRLSGVPRVSGAPGKTEGWPPLFGRKVINLKTLACHCQLMLVFEPKIT